MHLQKLTTLLQAMDKPQFKRLRDYVHSPYFKVPYTAVELFDYLEHLHPEFSEKKLDPTFISKRVKEFPNKTKQDKAGSELVKATYDFIALYHWQKKETAALPHLVYGLKDLNLYDFSQTENEIGLKEINQCKEQNFDTFYVKHLLTETAFNGFETLLQRNAYNDISPLLQTLDEFHALKKIRYICDAISRKELLGTRQIAPATITLLLETLAPFDNEKFPYVFAFMKVYKMLTIERFYESLPYHTTIAEMAEKNTQYPLPDYLVEAIPYSINWCLKWNAKGERETLPKYLWWIDFKMNHQLLLERNQITPISFRNIVMVAVQGYRSKAWIEEFIATYSPYLPEADRPTNLAFVTGLYLHSEKKYRLARYQYLQAQAKEEPIFNAIIRRWQFMNNFEEDPQDTDTLLNELLSFEKYLHRNEAGIHQFKPMFTIFIKYATLLLKTIDKTEKQQLKEKLKTEPFFAGKDWLEGRI